MSKSSSTNRRNLAWEIATRLCLIVSLWQAPVPWLHHHGTDADSSATPTAAADLQSHLAVFHASLRSNIEFDLGWHCHWVLPNWSHALDDTPDDEPPAEEPIAFDAVTISSIQVAAHDWSNHAESIVGNLRPILSSIEFSTRRRGEPLSPLASSLLSSVLRC